MSGGPVIFLLLFDLLLFLAGAFYFDKISQRSGSLILSALFFFSGMPALIYQIVWQRALFAIYGVNAESVAVVVSAFMLGLGLGSLVGGKLSARFPKHGILLFGVAELCVAVFGLTSLRIFHWVAAFTAGASLPAVVGMSLVLLLVPTMLMGATLPLLVEQLVQRSGRVGFSVSRLYFVNTFGSAVACFFCANFLLRDFGQSGSVMTAACVNGVVGASAYIYGRKMRAEANADPVEASAEQANETPVSLGIAAVIAGAAGFIALGFEIAWFRIFSIASSDRAPAFALLLATYLGGIAAGSYLSEKLTERRNPSVVLQVAGALLLLAGCISVYLPPLVAALVERKLDYLVSTPFFSLVAALLGSVLPLLCQLAVSPDENAGRKVSVIYVSNILGSVAGSLGIGFVLTQHFGLREVALGLGCLSVLLGAGVFSIGKDRSRPLRILPAATALILALALVATSFPFYSLLYERLIFGARKEAQIPFARVVENRNGVIGVTTEDAVFGGGVYDGYFNVDPLQDSNLVVRAYALSAFHPSPKHMLVVGLASGSWAQVFINHPQIESMDIVEINPGYLQLIAQYPAVRSLLQNPKVHVYVDDGRRWLLAHPEARYDIIVANNTYHWRDHSTGLLSFEYFQQVRPHLNAGGIYYFNTTESEEAIATALAVFPYGLRVINFCAVSDSPIIIDKARWLSVLQRYSIDGKPAFDPINPASAQKLNAYSLLADSINAAPRFIGMETSDSMRLRLKPRLLFTDDNMGWEWRSGFVIPWH
jgi:spermidine synthase